MFMEMALAARAVVACRLSPAQKEELVNLVLAMAEPTPIALAVGDGANDAAMISRANIGVGLIANKREGTQATAASDIAIGQFRLLKPLLFLSGRFNYQRICYVIFYCYFKSLVVVVPLFLFVCFQNDFSGNPLYDTFLSNAFYNLLFTLMPVFVYGLFNEDLGGAVVPVEVIWNGALLRGLKRRLFGDDPATLSTRSSRVTFAVVGAGDQVQEDQLSSDVDTDGDVDARLTELDFDARITERDYIGSLRSEDVIGCSRLGRKWAIQKRPSESTQNFRAIRRFFSLSY